MEKIEGDDISLFLLCLKPKSVSAFCAFLSRQPT